MLAALEAEVAERNNRFDELSRELGVARDENRTRPLSGRVPMRLVDRVERLKYLVQNAEYMRDKACTARGAVRDLLETGRIDL